MLLRTPAQLITYSYLHRQSQLSQSLRHSHDGDEEIEEDEASTWPDHVRESSTTPNDIEFNVEPEIDLNADGFLAVLAPNSAGKNKDKGRAEENQEIEENDG
ncbi:hypothetical protein EDB19DRAFT_2039047 [Suillus lakei]|nr:hypothetical protein EDB19DRAFT_2039047 [Suillus lakei]